MEFNFISFLSILPFLLFLFLLLWKKVPLLWSTLTMFLVILILQIFYWQMIPIYLINSIIKGTLVSLDIFVIILGAIFFLEVLKDIKIIDNVRFFMETFLKDYRVQVILLAWLSDKIEVIINASPAEIICRPPDSGFHSSSTFPSLSVTFITLTGSTFLPVLANTL